MSVITPQDLGNSLSVLEFLLKYAEEHGNTGMKEEVEQLIHDYENVIAEPDISDMTLLPYNRRDAYSILEYLKLQAEQLSDGRWTDFSDSDIGTVFLKLMSYLADMNNFQIDKVVSELYLDTCVERASAIALCALVGYEPRHYQSAHCKITLKNKTGRDIPNGTKIPKYSVFTTADTKFKFCNLNESMFYDNSASFEVYQGLPKTKTFTISNISTLGRIVLPDYNIGTNTINVRIDGIDYKQVEDVRFISGELGFSVHISEDAYLYIQLPSYWPDIITQASVIEISYLISSGEEGRIGKNLLTRIEQLSSQYTSIMEVEKNTASSGGYNPETVDELRDSVPIHARTMNTIVTIKDFEELGTIQDGIAAVKALDYNDPSSGLVQPDDYYKVYLYVLPDADLYDATDAELLKYRNTIIKDRSDWTLEDMESVAEGLDTFSKSSITGTTITLTGATTLYTAEDIVPSIDTGIEATSYLIKVVPSLTGVSGELACTISESGNNIIITLVNDWRDYVADGSKFNIYYKREQVLTEKGQKLREYIDERRLMSLNVTFHDLTIVQPAITVDIYMSNKDIRFKTIAAQVKDFIVEKYSRKNLGIGEPMFTSVVGADILSQFDFIRYCEVNFPDYPNDKIEVLPKGFIDVIPNVIESDVLVDKIVVNVYNYQNRII